MHKKNCHEVSLLSYEDFHELPFEEIESVIQSTREIYAKEDIWIMFDHPQRVESHHGLTLNQGKYLIFFVQNLSRIYEAMLQLEADGYYKSWPKGKFERMKKQREKYIDYII